LRVKDFLKTVNELDLNESLIWFVDEEREFKGTISFWKYQGNKLFGFAIGPPLEYETTGTIGDCLKIIREQNISEDTELWLHVPVSSQSQLLSNWEYDQNINRWSSEVLWERLL